MWIELAAVLLLSAVAVRLARQVALKKALLDIPNERSSHQQPVPRLGGAAFMPVVLLAVGWMAPRAGLPGVVIAAFLGGAIALFVVSLVDDFFSLSTTIRFAVQFAAAGILLWAVVRSVPEDTFDFLNAWPSSASPPHRTTVSPVSSLPLSQSSLVSLSSPSSVVSLFCLTLWIVALTNIYNFMDGIDGIAGLQAVIAGVAWCVFGTMLSAPFVTFLGAIVAAGALGFLTLNWPPAKIFMGDAGSTVLGYIFAAVPLVAVVESGWAGQTARGGLPAALLIAAVLVVWPFLADGTFTILRRLKKRENILKAHRSHLYQRLVIAGVSHRTVTLVYGGLALIGAVLAWRLLDGAKTGEAVLRLSGEAVGVIGVLFLGLWRWAVMTERLPARRGAGKTVRR